MHYCGGELERINYVVKCTSCCDGDDDDSNEIADGCCKDENLVLKNNPDFTLKQYNNYTFVKIVCDLFYTAQPFIAITFEAECPSHLSYIKIPPPKLQKSLVISTSVLRI